MDMLKKSKNDNDCSFRFSGHETFACRYAWLTKAATAVNVEPDILTIKREDDAMAELGVGKNMVRSIRFWATATDIITASIDGHAVTEFGSKLLCGWLDKSEKYHKAFDPYLEDIQTLWLIHWKLVTNTKFLIFAWDFLLNRFQELELYTTSVLRVFQKELVGHNISKSSIEQLWSVFLHSYVPTRGRKGEVREDNLDCPLAELDLLIPIGFAEAADHTGRAEPKYAFRREEKPEIGSGLFAYCLGEFWQNHYVAEQSIPFHLIANGHGSPGQVFKIPEANIRTRLLDIEKASRGLFMFDESAAIPRVRLTSMSLPCLEQIYE